MTADPPLLDAVLALEDWSGVGPEGHLRDSEAVAVRAAGLNMTALGMRAQLVGAEMRLRLGEVVRATRLAEEIDVWARDHDVRLVRARCQRVLARATRLSGDAAASLEHAVAAVELLDDDAPAVLRGGHLLVLADTLAWNGAHDQARERYRQAEAVYAGAGHHERLMHTLNNYAYSEYQAGEHHRAHEAAERLLSLAAGYGLPLTLNAADTVARARMAVDRHGEAEDLLTAALEQALHSEVVDADAATDADALCELLLTLAQAQRHQDRTARAQASLDDCRRRAGAAGLGDIAARALAEQAELHAHQGHWEQAYLARTGSVAAAHALTSAQQVEAAVTRHAILRVDEARSEAKTYRQQALRDPLTGLRNRRFVDGQLPMLLHHAVRDRTSVVVAIVDADSFKAVNDTFSHDVGDRVLQRLAGVLEAACTDAPDTGSFTARIGGEEFLLVLARTDRGGATARLQQVLRSVRSTAWDEVARGLAVTASIGAVQAWPGASPTDLFRAADEGLYAAKRAGRDRMVLLDAALPGRGA